MTSSHIHFPRKDGYTKAGYGKSFRVLWVLPLRFPGFRDREPSFKKKKGIVEDYLRNPSSFSYSRWSLSFQSLLLVSFSSRRRVATPNRVAVSWKDRNKLISLEWLRQGVPWMFSVKSNRETVILWFITKNIDVYDGEQVITLLLLHNRWKTRVRFIYEASILDTSHLSAISRNVEKQAHPGQIFWCMFALENTRNANERWCVATERARN